MEFLLSSLLFIIITGGVTLLIFTMVFYGLDIIWDYVKDLLDGYKHPIKNIKNWFEEKRKD